MQLQVLLLIFTCLPALAGAALVISRHDIAQDLGSETRLKKRSTEENEGQVEVQSVTVSCKVASRFAHTVMTSKAFNKANKPKEVSFDVDLPKTAFITNFTMIIEGKTYTGEVKEKEKAKKQYEQAVSKGQTAGLVRASGRKMEKFSVSVNIAALSDVTFVLTYEELLQRHLGQYEIMTRVKPKQLVQKFEIVADIYEPQEITFLDAYGTFMTNELLPLVEKTVTATKAHVSFSPTLDQQRKCPECDGTLIDGDFFIKYDVNREKDIGNIQIVNGYFVHFFAPADLPRIPKNVVFVIDISYSMIGTKIAQTRDALLTITKDLSPDDYFNIILFDHSIQHWRPSLIKATPENVVEAQQFIKTIGVRGSTNINSAVLTAVELINRDMANNLTENSVPIIILLTDGEPTSGETRPEFIIQNVYNAIQGNLTLFCLGFGYDLDYKLLDTMAQMNNGLARRIYEDADAALQLKGFYDEVANPLLSNIKLLYPENAIDSLTNSHFKQLYNGSEIVVAGRLSDNDLDGFLVEVFADGLQEFKTQSQTSPQDWDALYPEEEYIFGDFTERLWAYLTIQQLLSKGGGGTPQEKENTTAQALALSLKYNFVTPLTSMVVTKPQDDEASEDRLFADKLTEDMQTKQTAVRTVPHYAVPQLTSVDGDPHFIIEVDEVNDTLCFNIDDTPGTIFNLVKDPVLGVVVNGQTIGDKKVNPGHKVSSYFGRFGIVNKKLNLQLEVTPEKIIILQNGKKTRISWSADNVFKANGVELQVVKDERLILTMKDCAKFVIILHRVWKKHPYHQDYLGFYTIDSHLLSKEVHGLLGQFYHGLKFEVSNLHEGEDPDKPDATMVVKGSQLTVTRGWQRDYSQDVKYGYSLPCWFVHNNGTGLIDGTAHDYVVSGLFETSRKG